MSYHVEIAESAEHDITEISDAVAFAYGDPIGAQRLANRIFTAIESLTEMPARFPVSNNPILAALNCHHFAVGNFNIIYRIDEESQTVNVIAVAYYRRLTDFAAERV